MGALKLTAFSGEQPRVQPRLLPDTAAQEAIDVRLDDGGLTPTREADMVVEGMPEGSQTILRHQGEWYAWPTDVDATPGPVAQDRLYITGDGAPKVRIGLTVYPLAVPRPETKITATVSGTPDDDQPAVTRLYVYTWVTDFGEESEPSPVTDEIEWKPGQTVTLSGFPNPPGSRSISRQRIYRTQTGSQGTYLYFIDERTASDVDYVDDVPVDAFNEPLPSADWNAPPDDLKGLISLPNGMMAAFTGRDLYFCEPWRPHAWPQKYVITTDYPIVGLAAISSVIVVMTTGQPYLVSGTSPATMVSERIETNLPCINKRAIVDLGYAVAYPSYDGLVVVTGDGAARVVTNNLFDRERWLALSPQTALAAQVNGRYALFYDTVDSQAETLAGVIIIDVGGTPFLSRASERATALWYDLETAALYYMERGSDRIMRFSPEIGPLKTLHWRSKPFVLPAPTNFGAILVDTEGGLSPEEIARLEAKRQAVIDANKDLIDGPGSIGGEIGSHMVGGVILAGDWLTVPPSIDPGSMEVSILADGEVIGSISTGNRTFRLPSGFLARTWEINVQSSLTITQIAMGHSVSDLQTLG